jgi:hypothetical protein
MEENGVSPGKAVTLLLALHTSSPIHQFTKENRDVSFTSFSTL